MKIEDKKEPVIKKNTVSEMKNTLEGIHNGLDEADNWISNLGDKIVENTQLE